jgi:hypothetical protein
MEIASPTIVPVANGTPARWASTCRMVIACLPYLAYSGQYSATGSSRLMEPRSASRCTSSATNGLLTEYVKNRASASHPN